MNFSRLDDTSFPDLKNANPYAVKNEFDYTRWVAGTRVRLVNVLWNSDYSNAVKFEDDEERDRWFDSMDDGITAELKSNVSIVPGGSVKLPMPYDVCAHYNYMYIDIPIMTSSTHPVDYEDESGKRRWYFFINQIEYSAPNTTIANVQPDIWTNYINGADIRYMMLERGHAPVAESDTDTYLSMPISNSRYLLAPDINYDDSTVISDSRFVPFGNGSKYICFASTAAPSMMDEAHIGTASTNSSASDSISYSDASDWYGYQLEANGFGYGTGKDFSSLNAPVSSGLSADGMTPNGTYAYAVPASDSAFVPDMQEYFPSLARTMKCIFIADESMISVGSAHVIHGHSIYECAAKSGHVADINLEKSMFGFTEDESRFAKLYTYPYSRLELRDNAGHKADIRIENTGRIGLETLCSIAYPVLDFRVFFSGINGTGSDSYSWKKLDGTSIDRLVGRDDWSEFCIDIGIPTYSLYMDAATEWQLDNYGRSVEGRRRHALAGYHDAARSANLGLANAKASSSNAQANSYRAAEAADSNAHDAASSAESNAFDSADAEKTNAVAAADTAQSNTDNSAACARDNISLSIANATANTNQANQTASNLNLTGNTQSASEATKWASLSQYTTTEENQRTTTTTATSSEANFATSVVSGAYSGATGAALAGPAGAAAGGIIGAGVGVLTAAVQGTAAKNNASAIVNANSAIASATNSMSLYVNSSACQYATQKTQLNVQNATAITDNNNAMAAGQRDNAYNAATTNAANAYNMQTSNASRTNSTARGNAARTCNALIGNADRTLSMEKANADATKATSDANSTRTRDISILNAKENLEASAADAMYEMQDLKHGKPAEIVSASGDSTMLSEGLQGVQVNVRTQPEGAIAQTAAMFARYGYALNQIWDVGKSGLSMMKSFTYWKASDIWIDVRNSGRSDIADSLSRMFCNGITVWSNPEKIGKVAIYDN